MVHPGPGQPRSPGRASVAEAGLGARSALRNATSTFQSRRCLLQVSSRRPPGVCNVSWLLQRGRLLSSSALLSDYLSLPSSLCFASECLSRAVLPCPDISVCRVALQEFR